LHIAHHFHSLWNHLRDNPANHAGNFFAPRTGGSDAGTLDLLWRDFGSGARLMYSGMHGFAGALFSYARDVAGPGSGRGQQ
jgi:hypothetical protein